MFNVQVKTSSVAYYFKNVSKIIVGGGEVELFFPYSSPLSRDKHCYQAFDTNDCEVWTIGDSWDYGDMNFGIETF